MSARGQHQHPWVQPIIVAKQGTHEQTVELGARASAAIWLSSDLRDVDRVAFTEWLSGPFTKTVRRASYAEMVKVLAWARESGTPYVDLAEDDPSAGGSAAIALPPMLYADLSKPIARLRVAGTDLPRAIGPWRIRVGCDDVSPVTVLFDQTLTTGKATAQAAHATWMWMLDRIDSTSGRYVDNPLASWSAQNFGIRLMPTTASHLDDAAGRPETYPVRDAGLTEIAPDSLTALALPTPFGGRLPDSDHHHDQDPS